MLNVCRHNSKYGSSRVGSGQLKVTHVQLWTLAFESSYPRRDFSLRFLVDDLYSGSCVVFKYVSK